MSTLDVLLVGDIVGHPGRSIAARTATRWKASGKADLVFANAENSAAGRGLTQALADELCDGGCDLLTMGDHVWDQKEAPAMLDRDRRIVRALNLPPGCPGRGFATVETPHGTVALLQLLGRTFMAMNSDCPFRAIDDWLKRNAGRYKFVFVDFHAEATSEKIAMFHFLDGRVTALAGTHTHVQTADAAVSAKGTAYITDLGMTGPCDSVIGRTTDVILRRFTTGMPGKFEVAAGDVRLHGALVAADPATGRARKIRRVEILSDGPSPTGD